jgi:hypothetical protein
VARGGVARVAATEAGACACAIMSRLGPLDAPVLQAAVAARSGKTRRIFLVIFVSC